MANLQLRVGVFILMFGQMLLGFYRITDNNMIANMSYQKVLESKELFKQYNTPILDWLSVKENYETMITPIRVCDTSIEYLAPLLILATGWKVFALLNIVHLVITPMILFNPLNKAPSPFARIMQIMTVLQLLGLLLFLAVPDKKKVEQK